MSKTSTTGGGSRVLLYKKGKKRQPQGFLQEKAVTIAENSGGRDLPCISDLRDDLMLSVLTDDPVETAARKAVIPYVKAPVVNFDSGLRDGEDVPLTGKERESSCRDSGKNRL